MKNISSDSTSSRKKWWRVRRYLIAAAIGVTASTSLILSGTRDTASSLVGGVVAAFLAVMISEIMARGGQVEPPRETLEALTRLFASGECPGLEEVYEVLDRGGRDQIFSRHRELTDRYAVGMLQADEYAEEMRNLLFESQSQMGTVA